MEYKFQITIFTPTYNRAYILPQLYESIKRQTYQEFEWLLVDDGSTDETEKLVAKWIEENNTFVIRYYKQNNAGKCAAINTALDLAEGKMFFTVDSDDYLTDDAIEKILLWEKGLPQNEKFCGVAGNLGISETKTPNTIFQNEYLDGSALSRYNGVDGERAMVFYLEVHKKYKYPSFENENFMTEAVVWNRMANDGYKIRFFNDIIWIYEYRDDGLTKAGSKLLLNNPRGYGLCLSEKAEFLQVKTLDKLKMWYTFTCDLLNLYDIEVIAECIQAPKLVIKGFAIIHKLSGFLRSII